MVGVLGCMAERLKDRLLEREKLVDIVAGPDAYRDLPRLLSIVQARHTLLAAWVMISHHNACMRSEASVAGINSLACRSNALRTMRAPENACCWPYRTRIEPKRCRQPFSHVCRRSARLSCSSRGVMPCRSFPLRIEVASGTAVMRGGVRVVGRGL